MRAKAPPSHCYAAGAHSIHKTLDQWLSNIGRRRVNKTGPPPPTGIGKQRKLRNHQQASVNIQRRKIKLAFSVAKDTQVDRLIGQKLRFLRAIALAHPKQHQEAQPYSPNLRALHSYLCPADTLNQRSHSAPASSTELAPSPLIGCRRCGGRFSSRLALAALPTFALARVALALRRTA